MKLKSFCNATIEYVYPNKNTKSGYFLKEDHLQECEKTFPTSKKLTLIQMKKMKKIIIKKKNL